MAYSVLETASAAVDDEADEPELRRMLDEAGYNAELRDAWERYHAVSAAMRGEWCLGAEQLRARVWEALQGELESGTDPVTGDTDDRLR